MNSKLKATIVTGGMVLMLMAVAILAWDVLTAENLTVASDQFLPQSQIAAQP